MPDFSFGPPVPSQESPDDPINKLAAIYPGIAQILRGRGKEEKGGALPPCTIMLSLDGGSVKFCVSPKYGAHVCFGTIDDVTKLLHCLDKAIISNKVDWRPRKNAR
jgi:hypothetical protein